MTSIALERSDQSHVINVKPTLYRIELQPSLAKGVDQSDRKKARLSCLGLVVVITGHAGLIAMIAMQTTHNMPLVAAQPMMVSLIAPPAPEPELVPVAEPPKPKPKPIVKATPKKVVREIKPVDEPSPVQIEATVEPEPALDMPLPKVVEAVAETPKAPPKPTPLVEEKVEPPRFGVSYLNNPQPDYPTLSRRNGEEGRVLMKVLVGSDGSAKDVEVEVSSGSERLDHAAVHAVRKWRFLPARKNNQPLDAFVLVPIKFSLNG